MIWLIVKLKNGNNCFVGVDLLQLVMLMILFFKLIYLYQQFVILVLIVIWVLMFDGSMDLCQVLFWVLNILVEGSEMICIFIFLVNSFFVVRMVIFIFELVVMRIRLGLLLVFLSMQLFWVIFCICFGVCGICVRFCCDRISVVGLFCCVIVVCQVMVVFIWLQGCQVLKLGVSCRLVSCFIVWCVGLFFLRLIELWVQIMICWVFIRVVMCVVLWVYFINIRKVEV